MNKNTAIIGEIFNNWKVINYNKSNSNGDALWNVQCVTCGNIHHAPMKVGQFRNGRPRCFTCRPIKIKHTMSQEQLNKCRHGLKRKYIKEYYAWQGMKQRCLNPNDAKYYLYGKRGITVCDRWIDSFKCFLDDVGPAPSRAHSIDRINGNGNYEKNNVRWATIEEQNSHLARH
ncbi:MAG: hypothetical protein H3C35_03640 [Bacteroidetes bacterium]|nr:hypothetical protein [Bacteroidota bacterium]